MKLKNILSALIAPALLATFTACSDIDENDRWKEAELKITDQNVLIEDFTGQRCINCPNATDVIHSLQTEFGEDKVIAVGLHGGPTGLPDSKPVGLATKEAEEYYKKWNPSSQPMGVINRKGDVMNFDKWSTTIAELLSVEPEMKMEIEDKYNEATNKIDIDVKATSDVDLKGKLQLWVTEDNIKKVQMMPDGSRNNDYIHNHVFRGSVNGTWGEEFEFEANETLEKTYSQEVKEGWKAEDIRIVAFVYTDNKGVLQVVKSK